MTAKPHLIILDDYSSVPPNVWEQTKHLSTPHNHRFHIGQKNKQAVGEPGEVGCEVSPAPAVPVNKKFQV